MCEVNREESKMSSTTSDLFASISQDFDACMMEFPLLNSTDFTPQRFVIYADFSCDPNRFPTAKDTVPSAITQVGEQQNNDLNLSLQCTKTTEPATANAAAGTDRSLSCTSPNEALVSEMTRGDRPDLQPGLSMECYAALTLNNGVGGDNNNLSVPVPVASAIAEKPNKKKKGGPVTGGWPEQQPGLSMECDAALTLNNGGGGGDNNNLSVPLPVSVAPAIADKPNKRKKGGPETGGSSIISLEQLQQHVGKPREEAAEDLGVSVSTFKRISHKHGFNPWPFQKKNNRVVKKVSSSPRNATCSRELDPKKLVAAAATNVIQTSPPPAAELAMQDARLITFKAKWGDYMIKFDLPSTSKMVEVNQQVAERTKLKMGSFNISYLDEDRDWILITREDDLLRLPLRTTIRIKVTPITKLITLTSEYN